MTLVLGTNCGFVTVAPTSSPETSGIESDDMARAMKIVAPENIDKVVEIGWYGFFETLSSGDSDVGIYSHDSDNNKPDDLLSSSTFVRTTNAGWQVKTGLDISLVAGETYWLAFQIDDYTSGTGTIQVPFDDSGATKSVVKSSQTSLTDPWGTSSSEDETLTYGVYALYTTKTPFSPLPTFYQ